MSCTETKHSNRENTKTGRARPWISVLSQGYEACFLACLMFVAKDFLFSSSAPYPYAVFLGVFSEIIVAFWLYSAFPILRSSLLGSGIVQEDVKRKKYPNSVVFIVTVELVVAVLVAIACCQRFQSTLPPVADERMWLGNGMGTADYALILPLGARLGQEFGWCIAPLLCVLVILALILGVAALSLSLRCQRTRKQVIVECVLFFVPACILAVLFSAPGVRLLNAHGLLETWLFFSSIAILGGVALPPMKSVSREQRRQPSRSLVNTRHSRSVLIGAALVVTVIFVSCDYLLRRAVAPYGGNRAPSRSSQFVSLQGVSPLMQDATIAMEDHAFNRHHGFDWIAMHHALRADLREGQIKEGGSTITQQLAKNLFLTNDRTIWRKIEEAAYTSELERTLPKSRILELYLNTIDYGMGQRGITAAASYYFHKTPAQLTLAESAILVGIVPDPMHEHIDPQRLVAGQHTALSRMRYFFPKRYTQEECDLASWYPLNMLTYPDKDAWDRGATCQIPADWHGVKLYFFANPNEPLPIAQASLSLKNRLAGFLEDAHQHLHVVGIDHLGVYNDRSTRQEAKVISAHAYGQAIDISGFRFANGSRVSVKDHGNPKVMARITPLELMLNRHFDAVVDWRDDPKYHQTHFHSEVKGSRPTAPRPVQEPPAKSAEQITAEIREARNLPPRIRTWLQQSLAHQITDYSCGEACVAALLSDYKNKPVTEAEVMRELGSENARGAGSDELIRALKAHGETVASSMLSPDELLDRVSRTGIPVIVHLMRPAGHWIVVVGEWGGYFLIEDPQRGNVLMPRNEFYARFDGETVSIERVK